MISTTHKLIKNCDQNSMEQLITPTLKAQLSQSTGARELAIADTQANSPSATSMGLPPAPESKEVTKSATINE